MLEVTESEEEVVDIWIYVKELVNKKMIDVHVFERELVESVYHSSSGNYDHVLQPGPKNNFFVVIVVDLNLKKVYGHFQLDLAKQYT